MFGFHAAVFGCHPSVFLSQIALSAFRHARDGPEPLISALEALSDRLAAADRVPKQRCPGAEHVLRASERSLYASERTLYASEKALYAPERALTDFRMPMIGEVDSPAVEELATCSDPVPLTPRHAVRARPRQVYALGIHCFQPAFRTASPAAEASGASE